MLWARESHSVTLLSDGRVLAVGGHGSGLVRRVNGAEVVEPAPTSAEIWDPSTQAWREVTGPREPRDDHTAVLLESGELLVAGGVRDLSPHQEIAEVVKNGSAVAALASSELYDPVKNRWRSGPRLREARAGGRSLLLADGSVLVAGGRRLVSTGTAEDSASFGQTIYLAELWTPGEKTFRDAGPLGTDVQELVVLEDGRVLAFGPDGVELGNPRRRSWRAAGRLLSQRESFTATLLADGRVLIAGGMKVPGGPQASVEIYDPGARKFTAAAPLAHARSGHRAVRLPDGRVLVIGGESPSAPSASLGPAPRIANLEIYDPVTNTWTAGGELATGRLLPEVVVLHDGSVLITGGRDGLDKNTTRHLADGSVLCEVWRTRPNAAPKLAPTIPKGIDAPLPAVIASNASSSLGSVESSGWMAWSRENSAVAAWSGGLLVLGGSGPPRFQSEGNDRVWLSTGRTSEWYDPSTRNWRQGPRIPLRGETGSATVLLDGRVLVVGAQLFHEDPDPGALLFDPRGEAMVSTGGLRRPRHDFSAVRLGDGRVLVAGGYRSTPNGTTGAFEAELWDPKTERFVDAGSTQHAYARGTLVALPDNRALIVDNRAAEVFDARTKTWQEARPPGEQRQQHSLARLPDGRVLIAGGARSDTAFVSSAEIYDPATGSWSRTGSLNEARASATAVVLADGRVLVAGGYKPAGAPGVNKLLGSLELWDPKTGHFSLAGTLLTARSNASLVVLPDGGVLVVGGAAQIERGSSEQLSASSTEIWRLR